MNSFFFTIVVVVVFVHGNGFSHSGGGRRGPFAFFRNRRNVNLKRQPENKGQLGMSPPGDGETALKESVAVEVEEEVTLEDRLVFPEYSSGTIDRLFSNLVIEEPQEAESNEKIVQRSPGSVTAATALVAGTTVGAGILALPAVTIAPGFVPSTSVLTFCWLYMVCSGLLIAEVCVNTMIREGRPGMGLLAVAERTIGKIGGRLAGMAYLFIHYALLVAYMAQGGDILLDGPLSFLNLPDWSGAGIFGIFMGSLMVLGSEEVVSKANNAFVAIVIASFLALLGLSAENVQPALLATQQWGSVITAVPVMFVALVFHNVVPVITTQLEADLSKVRKAIIIGSAIPLLMFISWNAVILGSIGPERLLGEIKDPLEMLRSGNAGGMLGNVVSFFSEFAIITSFIGFVLGLYDYLTDAFGIETDTSSEKHYPLYALILIPPVLVASTDPTIFFKALDNAGTFGITVLFGIIPAVMAWKQRYEESDEIATLPLVPGGKATLIGMIGFALMIIGQQTLQKFGVI